MEVLMMEKGNIIGITLLVGIGAVILMLVFGYNSLIPSIETNRMTQPPVLLPEDNPTQVLGGISHSIAIQTLLPEKIEKVKVYKIAGPHFTRQDIISLGQKFNISSPNEIKEGKEGFSIAAEDGSADVLLMNSGWIEYSNSKRAHTINSLDVPGNLPTDEEAVKIATKFLKDRDLLPEGAEFKKTSHGKILGNAENSTDIVFWEDVQVWYGRKIDGKTVEGTQLMLAIGAHGDPLEFITNWRKYESYKEMPVKTPDTAFNELKTRGVSVGMNKQGTVSINNAYLAYRTKAGAETEEYLEPVWAFKGNVMVDGKPVDSVEEYIPALTDESVKSLSS
jgi:hypothetical protein